MNDCITDGKLQVTAAVSLLERSRLVQWSKVDFQFSARQEADFERYAERIDKVFGRLICWVQFSTGAEFLAKGVCLLNEVDLRKPDKKVPPYPKEGTDLANWAKDSLKDWKAGRTATVTHFGTLGGLIRLDKGGNPEGYLKDLCGKVKADQDQEEFLLAAYLLLAETIRNRDAHAYVPKVRGEHFWLVSDLFVKSFNLLVNWIPGGASQVEDWRKQAPNFDRCR